MKKDIILQDVSEFYIKSRDFNGIPFIKLSEVTGLSSQDLIKALIELVGEGNVTLAFAKISQNPHIKRLPDLPVDEQLRHFRKEPLEEICIYPSKSILESKIDVSTLDDKPFTKKLALGDAQLQPLYFDLVVLERYYNDPRYNFKFYDYGGSINISDEYCVSNRIAERDKIFIESFGLGYDEDKNRVVVVFLCYLAKLTSEHQQYWSTYVLSSECKMAEPYYRNSFLGKWVMDISIFEAFILEQVVINQMAQKMGRRQLFRETFEHDRPKEFSAFLRPTLKNYLDFVLLLDKMISDNIDRDFFLREVALKEEITHLGGKIEIRSRGSLAILEDWLQSVLKVKDKTALDRAIGVFRKIRRLRQAPAHAIQKNEFDISFYDKQNKLMREGYNALKILRLFMAAHPSVKNCRIPEWLNEDRIKIY